jgi:hypothetical protein
VYAVDKELVD